MTFDEVRQLVMSVLPKGRCRGVKAYILPRLMSVDELCVAEPWARFVFADEVVQDVWVVFVDEDPEASEDHRSRLIVVDDEIAEVLMDLSVHFYPSFWPEMQPFNSRPTP